MVSDRSRGQLIMIGAVLIAVVILGFIVILNTVLYTENVTSQGATTSANGGLAYQLSFESNAAEFVHRVNLNGSASSRGEVRTAVADGLAQYGDLIQTARAQRDAVLIDVSVVGAPTAGELVVHDAGRFTNGADEWNLTEHADGVDVRQFTARLEKDDLETGPANAFTVTVSDPSGSYQEVTVYRSATDEVTVDGEGASDVDCRVPASDDVVEIDFRNGRVSGDDCSFAGVDSFGDPAIEFADGDAAAGQYQLLANGTGIDDAAFNAPGGPSPRLTYAVYHANVTSTYVSPSLNHTATVPVDVYPPDGTELLAGGIGSNATDTYVEPSTPTGPTPTPTPTPGPGPNRPPSLDGLDADADDCDRWWDCDSTTDVTVSWAASDPDGSADLDEVEVRVVDQRYFGRDRVLSSNTYDAGDLTSRTVTTTVSGEADYVIATVRDDDGATDQGSDRT